MAPKQQSNGPGQATSSQAAGQTNVHSGVSTAKLDNYVPVFSNNMQDYREFRKRCEIYRKKMQLGNRTNEVVYNLVTLMTGKAWDLVEDMTMEQMSGEDAYDLLFTRLDRGFRFDPLTELPDDFEQYFVKLQRKPHQTLQDYMNDYTRCERRLKVTHNVELPEKVRAWWFLRRSGITKEQRQLILTNTGTTGLTIEEVMKSMSFILGQDSTLQSSSSTSRWSRPMGKPVDTFYCDEDTQYDWPAGSEDFAIDPSPTYFGEDYEWDDWHEGSSEQFDEVALAEHCEQVYDVDEYDDVLANYQDAKAQMNALRTSRGFYPVVAMLPSASGSHPGGKSRKGNSSKSKSKGKGKPSSKGGKSGNPKGRAAAAMGSGRQLCLRCGNAGHWARNCPMPPGSDKKRKIGDEPEGGVNMVESVEPPVDTTLSTEAFNIDIEEDDFVGDDTAVQDGGAASVLGSACQIRKYLRFLLEQGYNIHDIPMFHCEKGFKYGNSMKETTNKCIVLPVFLSNSRIDVLTYVIQGTAPILVGRPMLEKLGLIVDYRSKQMKWPDTDWEDLPTGSKGEHLLHLGKDIRRCIAQEPTMVLLPEDVESHVGEPIEQGVQKLLEEVMIAENANPALEPTQTVTSAHTRRVNDGIEEIDTVKRLHGHMLRKFERQAEEACRREDKIMRVSQTINKETKCRVIWEVFVGEGRTTKHLSKFPHVVTEVFSLQTGWDFRIGSHRSKFLQRLREEEPDELLLAPMCKLWSPIQELNIARSEKYKQKLSEEREYNHDTILTMCSVAYQEQYKAGRNATLEHPWLSRAWYTRAFACLEEFSYDAYVDQCMYGLKVPDHQGEPELAKKPTCFRTTKQSLADGLSWACDGSHSHVPIEGNAPGGQKRSALAESYPEELAKRLAFLMQEENEPESVLAEEDGDVEMIPVEQQPQQLEAQAEVPDVEQDILKYYREYAEKEVDSVTSNAQLRTQVGKAAMNYVVRLHKNLGHPGTDVLCRMREEVQATDNVMTAAKRYVCPKCYIRQGPAGVPPAAGLTARVFGERLLADTAWIDTDDGRVCVMTLMDQATRYIAIRIMKSEQSIDLVKGIERSWIKHFAVPKYLRVDEGKGFAAQYLRDWCSERHIVLEIAPAESHNWIGSIERKHQVVRRC